MNFMNGIDAAIQFDMELEHQDKLSFLDTIIKRNVDNLYPDVSNKVKLTDKGLFYNYTSFFLMHINITSYIAWSTECFT